jgi:hypothetical protein
MYGQRALLHLAPGKLVVIENTGWVLIDFMGKKLHNDKIDPS